MDHAGKVRVGGLDVAVADDDVDSRQRSRPMSAFGGNTDIPFQGRHDRF